jgi:protein O-GlcNAc transferase
MIRAAPLLVALVLLPGASVPAQSLPSLPELPLDTYEPAVGEPIAAAYQGALEDPADAARNGYLGMVLYAHEQYEFAEPCFERAHALDPGEGRWAYYLGRTQVYLAHHDRAAASLREALRLRPGYLPARVMLAQCLLESGQLDESRALYLELLKTHPETAEVHYGLGRIDATRGEPDAAVAHLRRACALFSGFGAAHFALARAYRDLGEKEKAREQVVLYQADKLGWPTLPDPLLSDIVALRTSATDHLRRGIQLAQEGQLQEAAEQHEAALEVDPRLMQAHINLIRIYGQLGQAGKAEEHYHAALAIDPNLAEIHYNYGVLLAGQQETTAAAAAFRKAIELEPPYAEAHNNLAYLLMTSGELDEAAQHYESAIENKPDYRAAHFNLGRILVQQGKILNAIDHLRQTLTPEDEETPRCTYALGAAHARAGNREEALKYMREARQKARALGQSQLLTSIEEDLRRLEQATGPR